MPKSLANENNPIRDPDEQLRQVMSEGDPATIESFVASLDPTDAIRALLRLNPDEQEQLLRVLPAAGAADLIEDVPDEQAADIIEALEPRDAASIVAEMPSDEKADLLGDLTEEGAEAILQEMEPEEANKARELAAYDDDVAGGLMVTEILQFDEGTTVGEVVDDLGARAEELEEHFTRYAYVVSGWGRLVGYVEIQELVLSPRDKPLAELMSPSRFVRANLGLDELKAHFEAADHPGVPVVDLHGRILGVVRRASVQDALAERAEREMLRMQGIVGGDEIRTLPTLTRGRRRLSWLTVNVVLNLIAASVIALYLDTLGAVIALAVFLPIISDMSGCTGNQAVAVSMRELSLGLVKPVEVVRVWLKEISVGALVGISLGVLLGAVAWVWKGNPYLGLVVGAALALNSMIAVSIGGTVPLLLKRFGVDPAVASGPILTTVTDICGFFLVLSFAALMLDKLT